MDTNQIAIAQAALAKAGYHLTGYEFAALCALPSSLAAHFWALVRFWGSVGGRDGIARFLKTGSITGNKTISAPMNGAEQPTGK